MMKTIKAITNVLGKVIIIGITFLLGLTLVISKHDIVKGTEMNPDILSLIGGILMLACIVIWKIWGVESKTRVDERIRIGERRRAGR